MTKKVTDKDVVEYLTAHPDFFAEREKLAMKMELPHGSRGTVSLVEKQVSVMRDRQQKARKQLNEFVASAEQNKEIYDKSRSLVLELLSANRSADFFAALEKGLKRDFKCKAYSLIVFGKRPRQINHFTSRVTPDSAREFVGPLMRSKAPVLGVLRPHEQDFLFRHQSAKVKSAAVLPVRQRNKQVAMLAFGNNDPDYFRPDMDTLFIGFIAEALSRLLPRHLPR